MAYSFKSLNIDSLDTQTGNLLIGSNNATDVTIGRAGQTITFVGGISEIKTDNITSSTSNLNVTTVSNGNINLIPNGNGEVLVNADPTTDLGVATKQYVDNHSGSTPGSNSITRTFSNINFDVNVTNKTKGIIYNEDSFIKSSEVKFETDGNPVNEQIVTFGKQIDNLWVAGGSGTNTLAYSYDGINWTASSSGNSILTSVCYQVEWNGKLWVAVGWGTNTVAYSYDGINWTASVSGSSLINTGCLGIGYNEKLWVIGGAGANRLAYSYDGINWNASANGNEIFTNEVRDITWNGKIWVAGGLGTNTLAYSYDGINWNESTNGNSLFNIECDEIAWNGKLWVGVGSGNLGSPNTTVIYSYDGITWTESSSGSNILINTAICIGWNGKLWVGGGINTNIIAYSYDGINWLASTSGTSLLNNCNAVKWNGKIWTAGGYSISNPLIYSYDGINWIPSTNGNNIFTSYTQGIAWNGKRENFVSNSGDFWVAGGAGYKELAYSYDGINWNSNGSNVFRGSFCLAIENDGKLWVAGGFDTNSITIVYSFDGINWIPSTSGTNALSDECWSIKWNGKLWIAGGAGNKELAYSYDGINWTAISSTPITSRCRSIGWNGHLWVAGGEGTNVLAYSYNGINDWTPSVNGNTIFTTRCRSIETNGKLWVAGGEGENRLAYSYDGINWNASVNGNTIFTSSCFAVKWNGKLWAAGGSGTNVLAYSYDGINWEIAVSSSGGIFSSSCYAVDWNGKMFVAAGYVNAGAYSYDGINWTVSESSISAFNSNMESVSSKKYSVDIKHPIIGLGQGSHSIAYSKDGIIFKGLGKSIFDGNGYGGVWNGERWIVGGAGSVNTMAYSYDGINWIGLGLIFDTNCRNVEWNGEMWVAVGNDTTKSSIFSSTDGTTWIESTSTDISYGKDVKWNGRQWIVTGEGTTHTAVYSNDGINWTPVANNLLDSTKGGIKITYGQSYIYNGSYGSGGDLWVIGGEGTNDTIITSEDGINWTGRGKTAFSEYCTGLCFNGEYFVAVGSNSNSDNTWLAWSRDCVEWTRHPDTSIFSESTSVEWSGDKWILTGFPKAGKKSLCYAYDLNIRRVKCKTVLNLATTASSSGYGKKLISNTNRDITTSTDIDAFDGQSLVIGDKILVTEQTDKKDNGIYEVTSVGSGTSTWQIQRVKDYGSSFDISTFTRVYVENGTANSDKYFVSKGFNLKIDQAGSDIIFTESDLGIYQDTHLSGTPILDQNIFSSSNGIIANSPLRFSQKDSVIALRETDINKKIQINSGDYFDSNVTNINIKL